MLLPALSLKQPWAYAVIHFGKRLENRAWKPSNPNRKFRGTCLLHASLSCTKEDMEHYEHVMWIGGHVPGLIARPVLLKTPPFANLERGGIVGICDVVGSVTEHVMDQRGKDPQSEWYMGGFALELDRVKPLPFTPCKGMLGFFQVDAGVLGLDRAILDATKNHIIPATRLPALA